MGTKNNPGKFDCYEKAEPDEPLFVLLARDPSASVLVRVWADTAHAAMHGGFTGGLVMDVSDEKIAEAYACADAMEAWLAARRKDGDS
jgi:hypothetical protein